MLDWMSEINERMYELAVSLEKEKEDRFILEKELRTIKESNKKYENEKIE